MPCEGCGVAGFFGPDSPVPLSTGRGGVTAGTGAGVTVDGLPVLGCTGGDGGAGGAGGTAVVLVWLGDEELWPEGGVEGVLGGLVTADGVVVGFVEVVGGLLGGW